MTNTKFEISFQNSNVFIHKTILRLHSHELQKDFLYTGVTNNLEQRIIEHYLDKENAKSFAGKYDVFYLLYYECTQYINNAIAREKEIKGWDRKKKEELINSFNPQWNFLNYELLGEWPPKKAVHRRDK